MKTFTTLFFTQLIVASIGIFSIVLNTHLLIINYHFDHTIRAYFYNLLLKIGDGIGLIWLISALIQVIRYIKRKYILKQDSVKFWNLEDI